MYAPAVADGYPKKYTTTTLRHMTQLLHSIEEKSVLHWIELNIKNLSS